MLGVVGSTLMSNLLLVYFSDQYYTTLKYYGQYFICIEIKDVMDRINDLNIIAFNKHF